jgi:hypothetical protein
MQLPRLCGGRHDDAAATMHSMAANTDRVSKGIGQQRETAGQLRRELQLAGVELLLTLDRSGAPKGGATLLADAGACLADDAAAERFAGRASRVLASGSPLAVTVKHLCQSTDPEAALAATFGRLRQAAQAAGTPAAAIEVVIADPPPTPGSIVAIRDAILGQAAVHIMLSPESMVPRAPTCNSDDCWQQLWRLRHVPGVEVAYPCQVRPACGLLSTERATTVLPGTRAQVPAGTAWVPMAIDVSRFIDSAGELQPRVLTRALWRAVQTGEKLHDLVHWPTRGLQYDSWLNRRLAIWLTGFGDLVEARGHPPGSFASLADLSNLLSWARETLCRYSRRIATDTQSLPALRHQDPSRSLQRGRLRDTWRQHWQAAIKRQAVRHRNLLLMSPWSVFPANKPADHGHADLLPVLRHADTCTLAGRPDLSTWDIDRFVAFHRRAWAMLEQRDVTWQIAERT